MNKPLLEAIVEAGASQAAFASDDYPDSLPLAVLTCVDPRLTELVPKALHLPHPQVIWFRSPGGTVRDPLGSVARNLALATALRPVKEVAVIGHSECLVCHTSVLELTGRFKVLGIDRARLPDDLVEFFGLFASETQNVRRSVETITASPLISPSIPVHGLLLDLGSERLQWVVNGYQTLAGRSLPAPVPTPAPASAPTQPSPAAEPGKASTEDKTPAPQPTLPGQEIVDQALLELLHRLEKTALFRILGSDRKVYGPVTVEKLLRWLTEGRIDGSTQAQHLGQTHWRPLAELAKLVHPPPLPPALSALHQLWKKKR